MFTWPSPGNETVAVSNQAPRGHVVAVLRARDQDVGVNANLTFHLSLSGSGHSESDDEWARRPTFIVIPETGAVLVATDLGKYCLLRPIILDYLFISRVQQRSHVARFQPHDCVIIRFVK